MSEEFQGQEQDQPPSDFLTLKVKLPREPFEMEIVVVPASETLSDVRSTIVSQSFTNQYTCFSLWFNGEKLNDVLELTSIPNLTNNSILELKEDPYNERESRSHILKIRELFGLTNSAIPNIGLTTDVVGSNAGVTAFNSIKSLDEISDVDVDQENEVVATKEEATPKQSEESTTKKDESKSEDKKDEKTEVESKEKTEEESKSEDKKDEKTDEEAKPEEEKDIVFDKELVKEAINDINSNSVPINAYAPNPIPGRPIPIKALSLSHWNPPRAQNRLRGHLLYLQITTLEGITYHITSNVSGFYINNSTTNRFDPSPKISEKDGKIQQNHSLIPLIESISPLFKISFEKNIEFIESIDPRLILEPTNSFLSTNWITSNELSIKPDPTRIQEQFLLTGPDGLENLRDWNGDFQSSRELSRLNLPERLLRDRLLNKNSFDFTASAVKGAVGIIRGEIQPMNPQDPLTSQIYLFNGIFYSFGVDSVGSFSKFGGDSAARYAVGKDLNGVKWLNRIDPEGVCPLLTTVVDYCGKRIVAQAPVPGIFKSEPPSAPIQSEDENETSQEEIPAGPASLVVYGSIEEHDIIGSDETFAKLFKPISESLHLKPHKVVDIKGETHELVTSIETKGLKGTDGRNYILDLYRSTPLDIEFIEKNCIGENPYPHRIPVIRHEAVIEWWRKKITEYITQKQEQFKKENEAKTESASKDIKADSKVESKDEPKAEPKAEESNNQESDNEEKMPQITIPDGLFALNPDVFYENDINETEELKQDKELVRDLSKFVSEDLINLFITEIETGFSVSPIDGAQLTQMLHKRGINLRYLGKLLKESELRSKNSKHKIFESFIIIITQEIISRSFKHVLSKIINNVPLVILPYAISHILNLLIGLDYCKEPTVEIDSEFENLYTGYDNSFTKLTSTELINEIAFEAESRFRYKLPEDWVQSIKPIPFLREISLKIGVQWKQRDYVFTEKDAQEVIAKWTKEAEEVAKSTKPGNKKKKSKSKITIPSLPKVSLTANDIVSIVPIIKDSIFKSSLVDEIWDAGKRSLASGDKPVGQQLLWEATSLHEQIYGLIHPDVAHSYNSLALTYQELGETNKAISAGRKAIIVAERTIGFDHPDTLFMYLNLAFYENSKENPAGSLFCIAHALKYWSTIYGSEHPGTIQTMTNIGVMLQNLKLYEESEQFFEKALNTGSKILGDKSIELGSLKYQHSQSLLYIRKFKESLNEMKEAYQIYKEALGTDNQRTKDIGTWLDKITEYAVSAAKYQRQIDAIVKGQELFGARRELTPMAKQEPVPKPQPDPVIGQQSVEEILKFLGEDESKKSKKKKSKGINNNKKG